MKRRNFISNTGIFAVGAFMHHKLLNLYSSTQPGDIINIGIIGSGDRGRGLADTLNSMPEKFSIKAACDILQFRLDNMKNADKQGNFQYHKEYKKMLDDKS